MNRVVPTSPNKPNRNRACSSGFCKPKIRGAKISKCTLTKWIARAQKYARIRHSAIWLVTVAYYLRGTAYFLSPGRYCIVGCLFAYHMIASAILFNSNITLRTLFRVGRNPIRCFRIVVAFLNPLFQEPTQHRIMPIFTAFKAEYVSTFASDWTRFDIDHLHRIGTVGRWAPSQQAIALVESQHTINIL